jgi:hypothetical protein
LDARLDRVLKYYHRKAVSGKRNEMSEDVTSLARRDRDAALASARERIAILDRTLVQLLRRAPPLRAQPPAGMAYTREESFTNDQSSCPLFRLPPELRNAIYTCVFYGKYSLPQFEWDEEHKSPKLNLKCAQPRAPPNELLRTCRSIYNESKRIYIKAKTQFWSDTTFTLALGAGAWSFGYLDCLLDEQVSHMTRVNITTHFSRTFTVHLRSGSGSDDSVTVKPIVCNHQFLVPEPLSFVESVEAMNRVQDKSSYDDVRGIIADWRESPGNAMMRFCSEHHPEPVVLSLRDLSRAGLMAVVAWTCQG